MSDAPVVAAGDLRKSLSETITIHDRPTPKELVDTMAKIAKFLTKMAVTILREDERPAMVSAANPASNSLLQASAVLEQGAIQFHMLIQQQGGLVGPGPAPAAGRGPVRMN